MIIVFLEIGTGRGASPQAESTLTAGWKPHRRTSRRPLLREPGPYFLVAKKQEIEKQIRAKFCGRYCYLRHHSLLQQAKKSVHWYISL